MNNHRNFGGNKYFDNEQSAKLFDSNEPKRAQIAQSGKCEDYEQRFYLQHRSGR